MKARERHVLRRLWFAAGGVLAVGVIALAVLMALGQLLLPLAAHYPDRVAQMLSARLGRPVHFASLQGYWQPSGPMLVLHQVAIGGRNGRGALTLPTARVKLDFGALVWPSRHWVNLRLSGLKLSLQRTADGAWHVAGFGVTGARSAQRLTLDDLPGNLWLDDLELDIDDVRSGHHYRVHAGPLRVSNGAGALRFAGVLRRGASTQLMHVVGEIHDGGHTGRLYVAATDVDLGRMLDAASVGDYAVLAGAGRLAVWLAWQHGRLSAITAQVDLAHLKVRGPAGTVDAPQLRGLVGYRRAHGHAELLFAPASGGAARIDVTGDAAGSRVVARARDLDPGHWLELAALAPQWPDALGRWLVAAAPTFHLASARLDWSHAGGIRALVVHFDHLGFRAALGQPGVDHAHGTLRGDGAAVLLALPAQALALNFAHVFRKPLAFSKVGGDIVFTRGAAAWRAATSGIDFQAPGLAGNVRGSVRIPSAGTPFLDLYAHITHGDVPIVKQYWPVNVMAPQVVAWLDHGLKGGSVDAARVILRGDMGDWPFVNHKGRFEARADISALALDYERGWPGARDVDVTLDFVDDGMLALVHGGTVHRVKVKHAVASIPDLGQPELILEAAGGGKAGDMLGFVRTSPIGVPHAATLDALQMDGQANFDFSMVLPLAADAADPFTLVGTVRLAAAGIQVPAWNLTLGGMHGALVFNGQGLETHDLAATFHGEPVTLDIAMGPQTGHANWPLAVNLHGRFSLAQLAQGRAPLAPLATVSTGSAPFDIGFHVDTTANNPVHSTEILTVQSNLNGIALNLPAPLAKPAQALWPLDLQLGLPVDGGQLRVILGNRLLARSRLPSDQRPGAVEVRLGGLAPSAPMPASGIQVRGRAQQFDISGWVGYALSAAGGVKAQMPPVDVDVTGENAQILGQKFNELRVQFHPTAERLALAVEGPAIKGTVTVPVHDLDKRGIVARFDRLYWPRAPQDQGMATVAPAASAPAPTRGDAADVGVAPSSLPPLHAWIGDLRFGDAHLGQARLETWPTAQGMHIDMLRTQSKSVHMAASGDWNGSAHASHTHLDINFSADNLGHMLDAFGFAGLIDGGQTRAQLDATWPGGPASFALANVRGTLGVDIGAGRIPEVKPGMGRLFGLMSIAELPRHLTVDFGNIFSKGFNFHSIKGHFRFADGNAWTSDLRINGLAADITVSGRVGLRARDYDQYVLAIPHIGNTLPIVGAVVGGPIGAAAGWAMQGLLGKGLNRAAGARYHIGGSWDHPQITLVAKNVPAPAASTPPPARPAPAAGAH